MSSPPRDYTCHARSTSSTGQSRMCGRKTEEGSLLCADHECIVDNCSRIRQESNPYCFVHKPAPKSYHPHEDLQRVTSR